MGAMREEDIRWMTRTIELAKRGMGHVSPNPMVGALIVRDDRVIGEGWHEQYGGLHAERNALKDCRERGEDPEGATMYVSLEPCCHYGKTPPCTEAIIENRIARVVYGSLDPNPQVAGKGLETLRAAGITVDGPVLEKRCMDLNRIFFHYISTGMPYVIMKYAMTADGKIATVTGDSKWITSDDARLHTHMTRKRVSAILVGIGTVMTDDPMLNCRIEHDPVDPIRVICDSRLRIPLESNLVRTAGKIRTILAYCGEPAGVGKLERLKEAGAEPMKVKADAGGHVDMKDLLRKLGELGIDSILIEGGSEIQYTALMSGQISELQVYIAPKLVGGARAKAPVGGSGIEKMDDCVMLNPPEVRIVGDDILLTYLRKK